MDGTILLFISSGVYTVGLYTQTLRSGIQMVKSARDLIKRQFAYAMRNLELAKQHLYNVEAPFANQHEDLSDILKLAIVAIDEDMKLLNQFAFKVWNWENKDYTAIANLPDDAEEIARKHIEAGKLLINEDDIDI